jgi:uncharacterized membrane protein
MFRHDLNQRFLFRRLPIFSPNILIMNQAHLHLLANHLPILGVVFGILILVAGMFLKQPLVKRTALGVLVLAAIMALPAYLSGEGAEEVLESVGGINENIVEAHEDFASFYAISIGVLGVLSLICLLVDYYQKKASGLLYGLVLVVGMVSIGMSWRLGVSGGEIRHTEIRDGAMVNPAPETGEDDD